jgi:molybdopterin molybdotransferase
VQTAPPFPDDGRAIAAAVDRGLAEADVVVIIGGASVGDHDHARDAAKIIGAHILFEKVSVRPGKPTWFAERGGKAILGLPGNPASAFVCARLFLRPMIEQMLGRNPQRSWATRPARLRCPLEANGARETYLRAASEIDENGQIWVRAAANQDSSLITVAAASDALILRAPASTAARVGDVVQTLEF